MMKRLVLLPLLFASPAFAQQAAVPDLTAAGNAADRATAACKRNNAAKCLTDTRAAEAAIDRALAILAPPHHEEPPATGWLVSPSLEGMPPIASSFDPQLGLQRSWGTGAIPVTAAPDVLGAFRMVCGAGDLAYIDPVVYPGTVGVSHLHQFYGLLAVKPDETYQSSRAGLRYSSCGAGEYALNKSNYWLPALLDGRGNALQPNLVTIYYKRRPKTDPKCNWNLDPRGQAEECLPMPQGLRMIAGFDMLDPNATAAAAGAGAAFYCSGPGAGTAKADNLEAVLPTCPGGTKLHVSMDFPNCWDGKHLDSPDHRSHLAYASYGNWGYAKCPATHPKLIPTLHVAAEYSIEESDDRSLFRLSSDRPGLPRGKTLHGDATIAWDPFAHRLFHENCIDKLLNCSGGDLGNGQQLRGAAQPSYGWVNPVRLVPVPVRP